jgi:hypothetical protein
MTAATRPAWLGVLAALVAASAVAGCGSSSHSTTTATTPALTKAVFLTRGNAICAHGNKQTDAAGGRLGAHPTPAQIEALAKKTFVPSIQAQINGIRALGAPAGDQATVTRMLAVAQADLDALERDPAKLAGGGGLFADFAKLAHPYGLTACAATS